MSTATLSTPERPPDVDAFVSPAPPYREFSEYPPAHPPEQCVVVLAGGQKLQGALLRFDPDAGQFELGNPTVPPRVLRFSDVLQLRMLRPLELRRQELPPDISEEEVFPASEQQTFSVEMGTGEPLRGETRGFVDAQ